jgi:transcriptional regulator with GAF, ATPase, and Fis domain
MKQDGSMPVVAGHCAPISDCRQTVADLAVDFDEAWILRIVQGEKITNSFSANRLHIVRGRLPKETAKMDTNAEICRNIRGKDRSPAFSSLILKISTTFINLPPEKIDDEIEMMFGRVNEFCKFDATVFAEFTDDLTLKNIHHYAMAPGVNGLRTPIEAERIPWLLAKMARGTSVSFSRSPNALSEIAETDRAFFRKNDIQSLVAIPLKSGTSIRGGLIFISFQRAGEWQAAFMGELEALGDICAAVLGLKRHIERMADVDRLDRLLSVVSTTYINLPPQDVDKTMQRDLGRLGTLLEADRCILYLPDETGFQFRPYLHSGWWPDKDNAVVMERNEWINSQKGIRDNFNFLYEKWRAGAHFQWTQGDELSEAGERMKWLHAKLGTKSHLSIPISVVGKTIGALTVADNHRHRRWPEEIIPRLRIFGEIFANALARKQSEESLHQAFDEIKQLKRQIESDYTYLREEIKLAHNFEEIIGESSALKAVLRQVENVAPLDTLALILGETGTGKELIARAIHSASSRSHRPMIKINCAVFSASLIESELFGHEKGAFTGAGAQRIGRFELSRGATLFLDEIGDLPLELQAKLLQVLQDGTFERVGGSIQLETDARVIAATNRDLGEEVEKGNFRRDLFHRLNAFPIIIPPLRERSEDIPILVNYFVTKYSKKFGRPFTRVAQKTMGELARYTFPGNIRELENMIERALITSQGGCLQIDVPASDYCQISTAPANMNMDEANRRHIVVALKKARWRIQGPRGAAQLLGLKPSTLRYRMRKLGIARPERV